MHPAHLEPVLLPQSEVKLVDATEPTRRPTAQLMEGHLRILATRQLHQELVRQLRSYYFFVHVIYKYVLQNPTYQKGPQHK